MNPNPYANKSLYRPFKLSEKHTFDTLKPVTDPLLYENIKNPFTGEAYNGILLSGEFASMDILNNNSRYYNEENYLPFVEKLREEIFSERGLYGELEHPQSYSTSAKNLSHKIVDIWYEPTSKKVFGTILTLDTEDGRKIRAVYESGGSLAISARAGGIEHDNKDGTFTSEIKMLITYDVVYHPGFSTAVLDTVIDPNKLNFKDGYAQMNEGYNFGDIENRHDLHSYITYRDTGEQVSTDLLFESKNIQEQVDEFKLENAVNPSEDKYENALQDAVDDELKESLTMLLEEDEHLHKYLEAGLFDGSAGFL